MLVNKTALFSHKESKEEEKNASRNNVMRITGLRYVSSPSIFYFLSMTLVRYINLLLWKEGLLFFFATIAPSGLQFDLFVLFITASFVAYQTTAKLRDKEQHLSRS